MAVARFAPLDVDDVALCCDQLAEVPIAKELVERIVNESGGKMRMVVNAIANSERVGLRHKGETVTDAMMKDRPLCQEWQRPRRRAA